MCRTKARNKGYIAGEWLISTHVACGFDDDNDCDDVKFIIDQGLSAQIGPSIWMTLNNSHNQYIKGKVLALQIG